MQALIAQFELQTSWFIHALENISDEEAHAAAAENLNPVKWVAGHLIDARLTIAALVAGTHRRDDYTRLFGKGTRFDEGEIYPELEQMRVDWRNASETLRTALREVSDPQLFAPPPFQTSIPDQTLKGLIAYFAMHEAFHLGQLSIYRKILGKESMSMRA